MRLHQAEAEDQAVADCSTIDSSRPKAQRQAAPDWGERARLCLGSNSNSVSITLDLGEGRKWFNLADLSILISKMMAMICVWGKDHYPTMCLNSWHVLGTHKIWVLPW